MHADAITPAETARCSCRFASRSAIGLPLNSGGSASASTFSRPARRSLTFRPAWSLNRPKAALCHQSASIFIVTSENRSGCYQPKATTVGWDSHPPGKRTLSRRTEFSLFSVHPGDMIFSMVLRPVLSPPAHSQAIGNKQDCTYGNGGIRDVERRKIPVFIVK